MRFLLSKFFTWHNITSDTYDYVKSCKVCAESNKSGKILSNSIERPVHHTPLEEVAVDIVGPLQNGRGDMRFFLT